MVAMPDGLQWVAVCCWLLSPDCSLGAGYTTPNPEKSLIPISYFLIPISPFHIHMA